jgi:hypothetical protein
MKAILPQSSQRNADFEIKAEFRFKEKDFETSWGGEGAEKEFHVQFPAACCGVTL